MAGSVWEEDLQKPSFEPLTEDIKTDVLIIGGGMTGLLCATRLKQAGVDCVIAEAKTVCNGVTKNTTAKISAHHGAIFDTMLRRYGAERTRLYWSAHSKALDAYRTLISGVDCDFEDEDSFVYSRSDRGVIEREAAALERIGCHASFTRELPLPFPVMGAVRVPGQAQFHPLKFAYALAKELTVFENTEVLEVTPNGARTTHGSIRARAVIAATHFPFWNGRGLYFCKLYQHRSYVLALKGAPPLAGIYVDASDTGLSFRSYRDLLLLGGGGHRTGKRGGGWQELSDIAARYYPDACEVSRFATQDCKPLDDIAYIGPYSPATPTLYVATGYNKWGMTSSMVAAELLTDLILGKKNEYATLFSPSRSLFRKQLWVNLGESLWGLVTPTVPRCSHLGCALHYNRREHSWDCACHGSRYTEDGRVIDNPAKKAIHPPRRG